MCKFPYSQTHLAKLLQLTDGTKRVILHPVIGQKTRKYWLLPHSSLIHSHQSSAYFIAEAVCLQAGSEKDADCLDRHEN